MKIKLWSAVAVTALAFSGAAQAGAITESFNAVMENGATDANNVFGEGFGASLSGQSAYITLSYNLASYIANDGYNGAPACNASFDPANFPCTAASYGPSGYFQANGPSQYDESWTQNRVDDSSLTISIKVNGQTLTVENSPGSNMDTDISMSNNGAAAYFEANTYGDNPNNFNYREILYATNAVPFSLGLIDSQSEMNNFVNNLSFGSFWVDPVGGNFNVMYYDDITAATPSAPEPGTIGLLGSALIGLGLLARRKRTA